MAGVLTGYPREKNITALIHSMAHAQEAENDKGDLPEEGNLSEYGRLYVRRSVRRSIKYNLITMFLLVLPVIFLLGMTSVKMDRSTYTYSLVSDYGYSASDDSIITENMIAEVDRIPGIVHADGVKFKRGDIAGFAKMRVYTEENADLSVLKNRLLLISEKYSIRFEDSAAIREENNRIAGCYQTYFLTQSIILFIVGYITSFAMLKARLIGRKRELSLLHAIGARYEDIMDAVIPETVVDYVFGAFISVLLGVMGVFGMMAMDGGSLNLISVLVMCIEIVNIGAVEKHPKF